MNWIHFTQYLRPDGRKTQVSAPMPDGYDDKVEAILAKGWVFEVEVLTTDQVSQTVSDGEQDVAIEISANNASVEDATKALIDAAFKRLGGSDDRA